MAGQVLISRYGAFTCPMKSVIIFVHNLDIDYEGNELLKLFDDCKDLDDVHRLSR